MILTAYLCDSLDAIEIGACAFDAEHRALRWNRTFTTFFPEHEGKVHVGEPYADNLRRFYGERLHGEEQAEIERYIAEGVLRHENQVQPFEFSHRGRLLRASSLPAPGGGRLRLWQALPQAQVPASVAPGIPAIDALEYIPDGAVVVGADDRIVASNQRFRHLYDVPDGAVIVGQTLDEIIAAAWLRAAGQPPASVRNDLRYDGAPFEVHLPGDRWRRVIVRHSGDGYGYYTHADITAAKRQQHDIAEARDALRRANAELLRLATTDPLTGLANRRRFSERLAEEAARPVPLSLLLIDIDHFKRVNDRLGHPAGDAGLRGVAAAIEATTAPFGALAARIGGEEFAVILPETAEAEAVELAQAIRAAMARLAWSALYPGLDGLTLSIGICAARGPAPPDLVQTMADRALYAAKRNGRDRIETVTPDEPGDDRISA